MLLAGVMRLIIVYVLTGNPEIGLLGAPIGGILCHLCIAILNLFSMKRVISQSPAIAKNILRPLLPAALMGAVVFGSYWAVNKITDSRLILCVIPIMAGVIVYGICAVRFKSITREDCLLLPKGEKIAKLLHL